MARQKLSQELQKRIVHTKGMTVAMRTSAKRALSFVALSDVPSTTYTPEQRVALATAQAIVRDNELWTALVAARAALGLT